MGLPHKNFLCEEVSRVEKYLRSPDTVDIQTESHPPKYIHVEKPRVNLIKTTEDRLVR